MACGGQGCIQGGGCGIMLPGWFTHMDLLVLAGVVIVRPHFMMSKKRWRVGHSQPHLYSG